MSHISTHVLCGGIYGYLFDTAKIDQYWQAVAVAGDQIVGRNIAVNDA